MRRTSVERWPIRRGESRTRKAWHRPCYSSRAEGWGQTWTQQLVRAEVLEGFRDGEPIGAVACTIWYATSPPPGCQTSNPISKRRCVGHLRAIVASQDDPAQRAVEHARRFASVSRSKHATMSRLPCRWQTPSDAWSSRRRSPASARSMTGPVSFSKPLPVSPACFSKPIARARPHDIRRAAAARRRRAADRIESGDARAARTGRARRDHRLHGSDRGRERHGQRARRAPDSRAESAVARDRSSRSTARRWSRR